MNLDLSNTFSYIYKHTHIYTHTRTLIKADTYTHRLTHTHTHTRAHTHTHIIDLAFFCCFSFKPTFTASLFPSKAVSWIFLSHTHTHTHTHTRSQTLLSSQSPVFLHIGTILENKPSDFWEMPWLRPPVNGSEVPPVWGCFCPVCVNTHTRTHRDTWLSIMGMCFGSLLTDCATLHVVPFPLPSRKLLSIIVSKILS